MANNTTSGLLLSTDLFNPKFDYRLLLPHILLATVLLLLLVLSFIHYHIRYRRKQSHAIYQEYMQLAAASQGVRRVSIPVNHVMRRFSVGYSLTKPGSAADRASDGDVGNCVQKVIAGASECKSYGSMDDIDKASMKYVTAGSKEGADEFYKTMYNNETGGKIIDKISKNITFSTNVDDYSRSVHSSNNAECAEYTNSSDEQMSSQPLLSMQSVISDHNLQSKALHNVNPVHNGDDYGLGCKTLNNLGGGSSCIANHYPLSKIITAEESILIKQNHQDSEQNNQNYLNDIENGMTGFVHDLESNDDRNQHLIHQKKETILTLSKYGDKGILCCESQSQNSNTYSGNYV